MCYIHTQCHTIYSNFKTTGTVSGCPSQYILLVRLVKCFVIGSCMHSITYPPPAPTNGPPPPHTHTYGGPTHSHALSMMRLSLVACASEAKYTAHIHEHAIYAIPVHGKCFKLVSPSLNVYARHTVHTPGTPFTLHAHACPC